MSKKLFIALLATAYSCLHAVQFTIVTPTYNNEKYCLRNIQSVVDQTYHAWRMIIINDCSTDNTYTLINAFVQQHHLEEKITIINNPRRKGALKNLYETIHTCPDEHVILTLDGDDWLATPTALARIVQAYEDGTTWLTYGQFMFYPHGILGFCRPFPQEITQNKLFRLYDWVSSHPRTFYAWLFKKIAREDLLVQGKFFPMAWDLAIMFPMLEMASNGHITCLKDILYIYNEENPLNDHKKNVMLQQKLGFSIAHKPAYPAL